jgi:formylglycine-generating enzyme required for sulfatase activity/serine/threonine protein kinase
MAATTSTALVSLLRRYQLLEPAQLEQVEQKLARQFPDPKALARELIQRGWLTPYQAKQISTGKTAELRLGPYVVLDRLGEGGMGVVLKARHEKMGRIDALKIIRKDQLNDSDARKRFEREVRAVAQLAHPNIVQAYHADEANGTHFLAMAFVAGKDLFRVVRERGPLPAAEACDYVRQAALGLQHAHDKGLVHRDIKPANLLVDGTGVVKILDLGIARLRIVGDETLTQRGVIIGSIDYMAPEQARNSHAVDIRADLYSLGCTFYFLLTGKVPFPGGGAMKKLSNHQSAEPAPIEQLRPDLPPALAAIVRKLMAKQPEERYQTPAELVAALEPFPRRYRPEADGATIDTGAGGAPMVDLAGTVHSAVTERPTRRPSRLPILGVGAIVALAGLALLLLHYRPFSPEQPPEIVDGELEQLLAKEQDPEVKPEALRHEIIDFCLKYSGSPQAYQAGALLPKLPRLENSIGMKLAPIPPGKFWMGSSATESRRHKDGREEPQHEVEITRPFYLGVHEVTVGQFRAFVQATGYKTEAETNGGALVRDAREKKAKFTLDPNAYWENPTFEQTDNEPVVCVSWNDACAFCAWLSRKERQTYVLPTEAQWEYCCRAGSQTTFGFGDDVQQLADHAWYLRNSELKTHPVGQKAPNAWGLADMHGNAWEWCHDWYERDYYQRSPRQDPPGPAEGETRVMRGGAIYVTVNPCRAAFRGNFPPSQRNPDFGFRVVLLPALGGRVGP